jgi:AraC-like DNA-binding protein
MAPRKKRAYGISSWITRAVLQELEARGVPADVLLKRHGLDRADLLDPDGWIPLAAHRAFYRDAIAASGDPTFQAKVGRRVPVHVTRAAGYCAAVSSTLGEAMEAFGRFSELLVDGSRVGTLRSPRRDVVFARRPEVFPVPEDGPSFAVAVLGFFAHAAGRPVKATRILMTGRPLVPPEALEAELGAPITWSAGDFEMHFPPGTLDLPVAHADPMLKESLELAARRELSRAGASKTPPASTLVREAFRESGFGSNLTRTAMANALGMSARTLQRRLASESTTYAQVAEGARQAAAVPLLQDSGLTSLEIAVRVGFSSRPAFHRAVKRWTGKTPRELRGKSAKRKAR